MAEESMKEFTNYVIYHINSEEGTWSMKAYEMVISTLSSMNSKDMNTFANIVCDEFEKVNGTPLSRYKTAQLLSFINTKKYPAFTSVLDKRGKILLETASSHKSDHLGNSTFSLISQINPDTQRNASATPPPTSNVHSCIRISSASVPPFQKK